MLKDENPEDVPAPAKRDSNAAHQGQGYGNNEQPQPTPAEPSTSYENKDGTASPSGQQGKENRNSEQIKGNEKEKVKLNESNSFINCNARKMKSAYNHKTRIYGKSSNKFRPYEPHLKHPFHPEIAGELLQLQRNLIHYFSTLEKTSVAPWSKLNRDTIYNKIPTPQDLQADMVIQKEQYLEPNQQIEYEPENEDKADDLPPRAPKKRPGMPKPVAASKPNELSKNATPEEFETWKDNFEAYLKASNAHNCSTKTQAAFLFTGIDPDLVSMLTKKSEAGIPTFSSDNDKISFIPLIERYFKKRYPLHVRRTESPAFNKTQKMKPSEYFIQAIQMMYDAEIMNATVHDFITSLVANVCPEATLRMQLLQADLLSIQTIVNKALTPETAKVKDPGESTYTTGQRRRTQYQNRKPGNQGPSQQNDPKTCQSCGSNKHGRRDCQYKDKTCDFCKIKGHLQRVCRKNLGTKIHNARSTQEETQDSTHRSNNVSSSTTPPLII